MSDMSNAPTAADLDKAAEVLDQNFDLLAGVSLRVSVEVGSAALKLSELLNLAKGSVVELDREANAQLDILANGTLIARGEVVNVDGRYGIRITELAERRASGDRRSTDRRDSERRAAA
jgi:flagellar motor switch protein FliN/FliY